MSLTVYGIPTCGTCKKALQWLDSQNISYEFVNLKINPPTPSQVQTWVSQLGNKPLRNTSGQSYRALGNQKDIWTDADWVSAFAQDPMLLKRPLFVQNDCAILAGFRVDLETLKQRLANDF